MSARITILLALYNGAAHLQAQLASYSDQTETDWALIVSDDGSDDAGPGMVARHAARFPAGRIKLVPGPRQGSAANFLHLLTLAPRDAAVTALSDQDDVWLPGKLADACAALAGISGPAACFGRTLICGEDLSRPRPSRPLRSPAAFANAVVQNVMPGNTIVLNAEALVRVQEMLRDMGPDSIPILHDWWLYQVLSGIGAKLVYLPEPCLLYRQHGANIIGANDGFIASLQRFGKMLDGTHADWTTGNLALLSRLEQHFTLENRAVLARFVAARAEKSPLQRLRGIRAAGVWRQTRAAQMALWIAALLGVL